LQGFLTYPRTETTKYAPTFDFKAPLKQLEGGKLGKLAKQLISQGPLVSSGGHDAGDHPPITPTSKAPTQFENPKEEQLYDLVSRFYMASLAGPAKY
jgi:DNA topoisomerase-3